MAAANSGVAAAEMAANDRVAAAKTTTNNEVAETAANTVQYILIFYLKGYKNCLHSELIDECRTSVTISIDIVLILIFVFSL